MSDQRYIAKYSTGDNAQMTEIIFSAGNDRHAFAIAVLEAPADATALHVSRFNLEYIGGGAVPPERSALINDIAQMARRFSAEATDATLAA